MITLSELEIEQIWGNGNARVFLSYVESGKQDAAHLKKTLDAFGIATFAAFKSITPTEKWERKIEKALLSMNILIALMTEGFNESPWANQEIGVAYGRDVPIFSISKGGFPKGLVAQFQAIDASRRDGEEMAIEFVNILFQHNRMNFVATDAFVESVSNTNSLARSNKISPLVKHIKNLTDTQQRRLIESFNSNPKANKNARLRKEIFDKLKELTGDIYNIRYSESSNRYQIVPKPPDTLVVGKTGESCIHSGEYRPVCHVEMSHTINEGETFHRCTNEIPEPHDTTWVLIEPFQR